MDLPEDCSILRIFIGESDRFDGAPLHEAIVRRACAERLAGATVIRGAMGFGRSSHIHTSKIVRLSYDLPLVVEIVDSDARIRAFIPLLEPMVKGGLVTVEKVQVVLKHSLEGRAT